MINWEFWILNLVSHSELISGTKIWIAKPKRFATKEICQILTTLQYLDKLVKMQIVVFWMHLCFQTNWLWMIYWLTHKEWMNLCFRTNRSSESLSGSFLKRVTCLISDWTSVFKWFKDSLIKESNVLLSWINLCIGTNRFSEWFKDSLLKTRTCSDPEQISVIEQIECFKDSLIKTVNCFIPKWICVWMNQLDELLDDSLMKTVTCCHLLESHSAN